VRGSRASRGEVPILRARMLGFACRPLTARAEGHFERSCSVVYTDFTSMYPTIQCLMGSRSFSRRIDRGTMRPWTFAAPHRSDARRIFRRGMREWCGFAEAILERDVLPFEANTRVRMTSA